MDSAYITCKKGCQPSTQRMRVADLVTSVFRHSGVQRVRVSRHFTSRNPEPRNTESTQSRAHGPSDQVTSSEPGNGGSPLLMTKPSRRSSEGTRCTSVLSQFDQSGIWGRDAS
jgi:hypothetical protein